MLVLALCLVVSGQSIRRVAVKQAGDEDLRLSQSERLTELFGEEPMLVVLLSLGAVEFERRASL